MAHPAAPTGPDVTSGAGGVAGGATDEAVAVAPRSSSPWSSWSSPRSPSSWLRSSSRSSWSPRSSSRSSSAPVGREARRATHGSRHVADVVATVLLLVLLAVESLAAGGGIVFLSMAFHSCAAPGNTCDVGFGNAVVYVGPVLVALVLVATLLGCTLRLVRRRLAWPVALLGIAAQVVVFSGALLLVDSAVRHGI